MKRTVMCLVPANIDELVTKGVVKHILQRDLGGYWDKVITVHPFAHMNRIVTLNEKQVVMEYSFASLRMVGELVKVIKEEGVCAIKAHDPYAMGGIALVLSKICHVPYVVMVLSSYELEWRNIRKTILGFHWMDNIVAWTTFHLADMVFGGNDDCTEWAVKSGAKRARCYTVRTIGVNEQHFLPLNTRHDLRQELRLTGKSIVLYAGRLSPEKFVTDVLDCFAYLTHMVGDNLVLLLAGDGGMKTELETKAERIGISDKVRFLGFQPQDKLIDLMYTSDVIVSPLTGSALVESALSGTPIVAYDIDWQKELIINECTGLVIPWKDTLAMAKAVKRLLDDRDLGQRLGMNARNKALEQHGLENLYRVEAACFTKLLGAKSEI